MPLLLGLKKPKLLGNYRQLRQTFLRWQLTSARYQALGNSIGNGLPARGAFSDRMEQYLRVAPPPRANMAAWRIFCRRLCVSVC